MLEKTKRRIREDVLDNKVQYLLLVFFLVMGITAGTFTVSNMQMETKNALGGYAGVLFMTIKEMPIDYWRIFFNAILLNTLLFGLLTFFSMMTVGIVLINIVLAVKGFFVGFAVGVLALQFPGGGLFAIIACVLLPSIVLLPCVCKAGVLCVNNAITVFKTRRIPSTTKDRVIHAGPHFRKMLGVYIASLLGVLIQTLLTPVLIQIL